MSISQREGAVRLSKAEGEGKVGFSPAVDGPLDS
jgi:hypothetical protein